MSVEVDRTPQAAITQRDLVKYLELKQQLAELDRSVREERQRLLQLVEANGRVEPGLLQLKVKVVMQRNLTKAAVVAAFGTDGYDYVRGEVAPTEYRHLIVEPNLLSFGATARDRRSDQARRQLGHPRDNGMP